MYVQIYLLVVFVCGLTICDSFDNEWNIYENSFKTANREEIFIANATSNSDFKLNFTVEKWKTLNVGTTCYTGGMTNDSMLVILFSSLAEGGLGINITTKIFDLKVSANDFEFFHQRKNGQNQVMLVVHVPLKKEFLWYTLDHYFLNKVGSWTLEKNMIHFSIFKMETKNMFFSIASNNLNIYSVDIYGFKTDPLDRWFHQSILLTNAANSLCLNIVNSIFFLSIPQNLLNQIQIYQFYDNLFIPHQNLSAVNVSQVVCFENGFKSFIAFNGLEAGIYQFTNNGLIKESIMNSNLEGIQLWLPIPINTYRDETIILCQRQLDHETHYSFDVDVVTYNGNRFEEHEDIPCLLFGEEQNGLKCLTDYDSKTGILGTSYIAVLEYLSLIIPVTNGTSMLFDLNIGIRKVEHPAKEEFERYTDRRNSLQAMMEEQNKEQALLVAQHKSIIEQTTAFSKKYQTKTIDPLLRASTSERDKLKILKLKDEIEQVVKDIESLNEKNGDGIYFKRNEEKYKTVIFNGPVEIVGELRSERINSSLVDGENADLLLHDFVRKDQLKSIEGHKTFADLTVKEINFENINGILSGNFISNNDDTVQLNGDLIFNNIVNAKNIKTTSKSVNKIDTDAEWINFIQNIQDPLEFEQIKVRKAFNTKILIDEKTNQNSHNLVTLDELNGGNQFGSLLVPGNITVETLNGHNFEKFLKKLCLKSIKCHIPRLKVNGVIRVRDGCQINYLNGLKFPEDYVALESTDEAVNITGFKEFTNITRGYKVQTENRVNNIDLDKIITRSNEQNISRNITFHDLEVASVLTVSGKVKGQGIENFVPNLGLKETKIIKSNVNFLDLEVQGDIIIKNNFNDTNFTKFLQDFILRDEENIVINENKFFSEGFTALKNLHIDSNSINDISLDSFITKNTSQELQIVTILGTIDFDHLYVKGLFDGEDILELNKTLVKPTEDQNIDSELEFLEHLNTENIAFEKLNDLKVEENFSRNKNDTLESIDTIFDDLNVEDLVVEGNIIGHINRFNLKELRESYLSYTQDQTVSEPYYVHKLTLDFLKHHKINNIESENVFFYQKFKDNITDFLIYRNPNIENLNLDGNLNIKIINGENMDHLVDDNIFMKIYSNESSNTLTIDGDVYFDTLQIQNLAAANFDDYVNSLIFKNETDVEINNLIVFKNGIKVEKLIETKTLNDVELENILRKGGQQVLLGPVDILGNVTVKYDLTVKGMVNNVDVSYILDSLDMEDNLTTVKGEVMFHRLAYIKNLVINGSVNGQDLEKVKSKFVYTNRDIELEEDTVFNKRVLINGNLGIKKDINEVILSDFVSRVAWITKDTDIEGSIRFTRPVECYKFMNVDKTLNTHLMFGKNLENHVDNGVFVNKGLLRGSFNFENIIIHENLNTKLINDINMNDIVPLKSAQEIDTLNFTEMSVFHDIPVANKVNNIKLKKELRKTVLKNVQQEITSEVVFLNNVLIEDNLITSRINSKLASKIVTTNTDQNLTATYNFNTKSWADAHLVVYGLIDRINLTFWKNYAISMNLEDSQKIGKQWTVVEDLNLVGSLNGDGSINGINMTKLAEDVRERESYKCEIEKGIINDYKNLCTDVTYIYENAKNQIYKFKYFEELQKISLPNKIHSVKQFKHQGKYYLLVNENENCFSHLMEFRKNGFYTIRDVHTGVISQVEIAKDQNDTFLITTGRDTSKSVCLIRFSTVVWRFINEDLQVLAHFENQELLQESQVPLTFYGLRHGVVTEFKIDKLKESIKLYRKWDVTDDNIAFFPRGLNTGLALRTGKNIIFLDRNDPIIDEDFGADTEASIKGTSRRDQNFIVPGRIGGDITVTNVGVKRAKNSLLAVANHKEAKVEHRLDIVEIYSDPFTGELFDKISTYKPSYLTSIEFENGETLLAFMEEKKVLQIYEYKGIEGFKHRSSIKIPASQLFLMELPVGENLSLKKVLGLVHKNKITLLQAIMIGNKIIDNLNCTFEQNF